MTRNWNCSFHVKYFVDVSLSGNINGDNSRVRCVDVLNDNDIGFNVSHGCGG